MTMENQSNWDELRDNALADNTAQGIFKHLKELEADHEGMYTRWPWELLQNARDASISANTPLIASIEHKQGELVFRHNGRGFDAREITHLIHHGSTKVETDEALGKFGSGFLTTHLLSPEIEVSGQLVDTGQLFKFRLKREASSYKALRGSMDESWKNFQRSLSTPHTEALPDNFTTQFRYPIENRAVGAVKYGLETLKRCAPFVVAFNEVFSRIDLKSPDGTTSFEVTERAPLSQDGLQEITVLEKGNRKKYLLAESGKTSVAVALEPTSDGSKTLMPINNTPRLFLGFPLIGTENFSFPAVINSFEFTPTEARDGVYLGRAEDEANRKNQAVIEDACKLLISLLQFTASSGWRNTYRLANVPAIRDQSGLNKGWLRRTLKNQFIEKVRQTPAVLGDLDPINPIIPQRAILPFAEQDPGVKALWDLLGGLEEYRQKLPRKSEAVGWCKALESWAVVQGGEPMSFDEAIDGVKLAEYIQKETRGDEDWGKIEDLQNLLREDIEAVEWLNQLHDFLNQNGLRQAVSEYHIVLDQAGFLDKLSNLHRDQGIDEELKDIAELLGWNIRRKLRDTRLTALADQIGAGGERNREYVVQELISKINERDPDDKFSQASVRLFKWIVDQEDWNRLRGFPVFTKEDGSGSLKVLYLPRDAQDNDRLLAPVRAWSQALQEFSDLFPPTRILSDAFFEQVPSPDTWQKLNEHGFIRTDVITTNTASMNFNEFLLDEPLVDGEHRTVDPVLVKDIVYRGEIMNRVRDSRDRAFLFWCFLNKWVIQKDIGGLDLKMAECECEDKHRYYQALWLKPLRENTWIRLKNDARTGATAESLADLLRDNGWEASSLSKRAIKLLKAIGVKQVDLTLEFVAENSENRQELENAFNDILATAGGDINYLNQAREDIKDRKRIKQIVHENQHLGKLVEELVRENLESAGFNVKREHIGADFEISAETDDVATLALTSKKEREKSWLIEVKATRGQKEVRMTATQARNAVKQGDRFLLCVVPVEDVKPDLDTVRGNMRFVKNIGGRVDQLCDDLDGFEELRDEITAAESSGVQLEVVLSGTARIRVASFVWETDGFPLKDLAKRLG